MYRWMVTWQCHDREENYGVSNEYVKADSIGEAIDIADKQINQYFEDNGWSDYHITSVVIVPELH